MGKNNIGQSLIRYWLGDLHEEQNAQVYTKVGKFLNAEKKYGVLDKGYVFYGTGFRVFGYEHRLYKTVA